MYTTGILSNNLPNKTTEQIICAFPYRRPIVASCTAVWALQAAGGKYEYEHFHIGADASLCSVFSLRSHRPHKEEGGWHDRLQCFEPCSFGSGRYA